MTMLPPTPPLTPNVPSLQANSSKSSSSGNGREFANTLDKATAQSDAREGAAKSDESKTRPADAKSDETKGVDEKSQNTETLDAKSKETKPADGEVVDDATKVEAEAGTNVAVITANLQATETIEPTLPVVTDAKVPAVKTDGTVAIAIEATAIDATPVVAEAKAPGATVQPTTAAPTPAATTQPNAAPTTGVVPTPELLPDGVQVAADVPAEAAVKELAAVVDDAATTAKPAAETTVRPTADTIINNLNRTTEAAAPKLAHAPQTLPEPVRQVVQLVHPLRHQGDGDYKLTLQLYPEHLGRVEVAVTLNSGQISMQLTADNQQSRQMLREAMGDLRQALSDSGLSTGSLDVSDHQFNGQSQKETTQSGQIHGTAVDMDEDTFLAGVAERVNTNQAATDGAVDVRV